MKLIVEIDEEIYKEWKWEGKYASHSFAQKVILNGTPLPKGHGDLIDRSKLVPDCYELEIHDGDDWRNEYCGVSLMQIEEDAEVIVKTDGGVE